MEDIYVYESKCVKEGGTSHHYPFDQDEWVVCSAGRISN